MKQINTKSLINYIALKILGGKDYTLDALEEYLVKGVGPATVARKYNISKYQLRGYSQRIIEKTGSEIRARKIIPILKQISQDVKPIIKRTEPWLYVCDLCGAILTMEATEEHVRNVHKDVLTVTVKNMMKKLEEFKRAQQKTVVLQHV